MLSIVPFPSNFPSDEERKRVLTEDEFYQLYNSDLTFTDDKTERGKFRLAEFFSNDLKKAKILDTALNLAPLVIDSATDFLFGEPVKISVEQDEDGDTPDGDEDDTED